MIIKEGFTKIVNFMTCGAGFLVLESGHISHIMNIMNPMGHMPHLRKQLKSINTNDYIKTLIRRRKKNYCLLFEKCKQT